MKEEQAIYIKGFKDYFSNLYSKVDHFHEKTSNILVISQCGFTKSDKCNIPARDMYLGKGNQYLLKNLRKDVDWIIVSGGYGVISSNTLISPYDDDMMKITRKNMKGLKSFLRFTEDIGEIAKQGYDEIIFCVSDRWLCNIDLDYIRECSPNAKFIIFPAKGFKGYIPDNTVKIYPKLSDCSRLKAIIVYIKEKITADYLNSGKDICEYLEDIDVEYKL